MEVKKVVVNLSMSAGVGSLLVYTLVAFGVHVPRLKQIASGFHAATEVEKKPAIPAVVKDAEPRVVKPSPKAPPAGAAGPKAVETSLPSGSSPPGAPARVHAPESVHVDLNQMELASKLEEVRRRTPSIVSAEEADSLINGPKDIGVRDK